MSSITRSLKQDELTQLLLDKNADVVKMPWLKAARIAANESLLKVGAAANDELTQAEAKAFAQKASQAHSDNIPTIDPWDMEKTLKAAHDGFEPENSLRQGLKDEMAKGLEAAEKYLEYPTTETSIRNYKSNEPVWHEGMFICWD